MKFFFPALICALSPFAAAFADLPNNEEHVVPVTEEQMATLFMQPDSKSHVVTMLPFDEEVLNSAHPMMDDEAKEDGWFWIEHEDIYPAYIHRSTLGKNLQLVHTARAYLKSDTESPLLTTLSTDDPIDILDIQDDWVQVTFNKRIPVYFQMASAKEDEEATLTIAQSYEPAVEAMEEQTDPDNEIQAMKEEDEDDIDDADEDADEEDDDEDTDDDEDRDIEWDDDDEGELSEAVESETDVTEISTTVPAEEHTAPMGGEHTPALEENEVPEEAHSPAIETHVAPIAGAQPNISEQDTSEDEGIEEIQENASEIYDPESLQAQATAEEAAFETAATEENMNSGEEEPVSQEVQELLEWDIDTIDSVEGNPADDDVEIVPDEVVVSADEEDVVQSEDTQIEVSMEEEVEPVKQHKLVPAKKLNPNKDRAPNEIPRSFQGKLKINRFPIGKKSAYTYMITDARGHKIGYLNTDNLVMSVPLSKLVDQSVIIVGLPEKLTPGGSDIVIKARSLRVK